MITPIEREAKETWKNVFLVQDQTEPKSFSNILTNIMALITIPREKTKGKISISEPGTSFTLRAAFIKDFNEDVFRKYLEIDKPDYVAFTLFTTQVFNAYRLIKVAKTLGCITIVGGPHVSSLGGEEVKKECPEIDYLFFICKIFYWYIPF